MKNNEQQILDEIKSMMASIRQQIELLDAKMAELQQVTFRDESEIAPIELDIAAFPDDDLPFGLPESTVESAAVQTEEPVVVQTDAPVAEDVDSVCEPEVISEEEPPIDVKVEAPEAIIDAMTEKQAWRSDMPGSPVKDVRLAISLHERVLFINHLFSEDPMAFQSTINRINASESLDQVVEYVQETFPQWNLESDLVYRFMMAVRRKIR